MVRCYLNRSNVFMRPYARYLKPYARRLRGTMTDAEQRLWFHVRRNQINGIQFYRQMPLGRYIVDFYAPAAKLIVEVDGGQHFTAEGRADDARRDTALAQMGLRVLRFDDREVLLETRAVLDAIWSAINDAT